MAGDAWVTVDQFLLDRDRAKDLSCRLDRLAPVHPQHTQLVVTLCKMLKHLSVGAALVGQLLTVRQDQTDLHLGFLVPADDAEDITARVIDKGQAVAELVGVRTFRVDQLLKGRPRCGVGRDRLVEQTERISALARLVWQFPRSR